MDRIEDLAHEINNSFKTGRSIDDNYYIHWDGHEIAFDTHSEKGFNLWVDGVRTACQFERGEGEFFMDLGKAIRWAETIILYYLPA